MRELVNTRIVNVLSKSLGVIARNEQSLDVVSISLPRNSEVPLERMTDFGTDADNQAAVDIRVMSGERDSPDPLDCQEVGVAIAQPARAAAGPEPDPGQVRHQQRRPSGRLGDRPDRRRLDRRRVPDRGRHERRGSRRTVDGTAVVECVVIRLLEVA